MYNVSIYILYSLYMLDKVAKTCNLWECELNEEKLLDILVKRINGIDNLVAMSLGNANTVADRLGQLEQCTSESCGSDKVSTPRYGIGELLHVITILEDRAYTLHHITQKLAIRI